MADVSCERGGKLTMSKHEHCMTRVAIFTAGGLAAGNTFGKVACIFMAIAWLIGAFYARREMLSGEQPL